MPQVDTNGIKIEYRFDGKEGAPYITFVTGIANDLTMWDAQVQALGKDYRTLRYDLRGHGDTLATEHAQRVNALVPCCCRAKMVPEFAAMWQKLREAVANDGVEVIVEPTA